MNQVSDTDPARLYRDSQFPGRRLIAWAVGIWAVGIVLPGWILNPDALPAWVAHVQTFLVVLAIPLYFIGFWKAVVGKGYPRVLFLMSFAPLIGLLILFFIPHREDRVSPKAANKASLLTTDPPPVPAAMTATTSTRSRSRAPGQAQEDSTFSQ